MQRVPLPITTYIRKDQLQKEYLEGLHKRVLDEKFAYVGKRQANSWIDRCNSPAYTYFRNSKTLLEGSIDNFVSTHKGDVNVIALGPGNALKEEVVVEAFQERHRVSLFFVDVSREILNTAIANVADSDVLKEVFIADLRNFMGIKDISQYVKRQYNSTNFFTLLGNTLGNYPQAMILKTIRNALTPGDKILIDVSAKPEGTTARAVAQANEVFQEYNNATDRERILALLSEANIEETDGTIEVEFGKDEFFPQIEVVKQFFRFGHDKIVNYCGEDVYFAKGERILVGYSNKYTFKSLANILTSHGLHITRHTRDEEGRYYQILCELA